MFGSQKLLLRPLYIAWDDSVRVISSTQCPATHESLALRLFASYQRTRVVISCCPVASDSFEGYSYASLGYRIFWAILYIYTYRYDGCRGKGALAHFFVPSDGWTNATIEVYRFLAFFSE